MLTKKEYQSLPHLHNEYLSQFITEDIIALVSNHFNILDLVDAYEVNTDLESIDISQWYELVHVVTIDQDVLKETGEECNENLILDVLQQAAKNLVNKYLDDNNIEYLDEDDSHYQSIEQLKEYILEIPQQDPSLPWHTVKTFNSKERAIAYSDEKLGTDKGWYCMLSYDGEYYICDTPNPNLNSTNNQHLEIEAFHHKQDCLDFIQANFNADSEGNIYLISEV